MNYELRNTNRSRIGVPILLQRNFNVHENMFIFSVQTGVVTGCRILALAQFSILKKGIYKNRGILLTSIQNILKLDLNTISVNKESEMFSKFQLKLNETCMHCTYPDKKQHEGQNVTKAIFD